MKLFLVGFYLQFTLRNVALVKCFSLTHHRLNVLFPQESVNVILFIPTVFVFQRAAFLGYLPRFSKLKSFVHTVWKNKILLATQGKEKTEIIWAHVTILSHQLTPKSSDRDRENSRSSHLGHIAGLNSVTLDLKSGKFKPHTGSRDYLKVKS